MEKNVLGKESAVMASVCAIKDSILATIASTRYAQKTALETVNVCKVAACVMKCILV